MNIDIDIDIVIVDKDSAPRRSVVTQADHLLAKTVDHAYDEITGQSGVVGSVNSSPVMEGQLELR